MRLNGNLPMPPEKALQTTYNLRHYENAEVVNLYRVDGGLQIPENAILNKIKAEFLGKRILDIGVGAGRTTPALLEISNDYVGIDAACSMISACRAKFPAVSF